MFLVLGYNRKTPRGKKTSLYEVKVANYCEGRELVWRSRYIVGVQETHTEKKKSKRFCWRQGM